MRNRLVATEKLDNLTLHGQPLLKALNSLAWVNKWLGNNSAVINAIHGVFKEQEKALSIVDLGCGGGDLILAVAKSLRKQKIKFTITGIDGNANSVAFAKEKCAGFREINFVQVDILQDEFNMQPCDILISSHFVYHFAEEKLIDFLKKNLPVVSTAIIISELKRNLLAMRLFKFIGFLLPISKLAKQDGLLAIKRSFTKKEWLSMLQQAGIGTYRLQTVPLFRILLTIFPITKI